MSQVCCQIYHSIFSPSLVYHTTGLVSIFPSTFACKYQNITGFPCKRASTISYFLKFFTSFGTPI